MKLINAFTKEDGNLDTNKTVYYSDTSGNKVIYEVTENGDDTLTINGEMTVINDVDKALVIMQSRNIDVKNGWSRTPHIS